jgi:hypothetical protein
MKRRIGRRTDRGRISPLSVVIFGFPKGESRSSRRSRRKDLRKLSAVISARAKAEAERLDAARESDSRPPTLVRSTS